MAKLKHSEKVRIARRMCEGMSREHPFFFGFGIFGTRQWEARRMGIRNRMVKEEAAVKARIALREAEKKKAEQSAVA